MLQARKPFILVPVGNVEWFLAVVNVPGRQLFDSHIRQRQRALAPHVPFDFVGILLEDEQVEMVEIDDAFHLIGKNPRQLFRLTAGGEPLRDAKQRFISLRGASRRESQVCAHCTTLHSMRDYRGQNIMNNDATRFVSFGATLRERLRYALPALTPALSTVRHLTPAPSTVSTFDTPLRTPLFRWPFYFNELATTPARLVLAYPLPLLQSGRRAAQGRGAELTFIAREQ